MTSKGPQAMCVRPEMSYGNRDVSRRCGARTRRGEACRQAAMSNGRCRMHGGTSTGPRTPEGIARCTAAATKHGRRNAAARAQAALRGKARSAIATLRRLLVMAEATAEAREREPDPSRELIIERLSRSPASVSKLARQLVM